jgi:ThiF family protein
MDAPAAMNSMAESVIVRIARPEFDRLRELLFRRYPDEEWATFARFGWRSSPLGLVCTLAHLCEPRPGDMDDSVGHVRLLEPYSLRLALEAEQDRLAVGVIHSHPRECRPLPSTIDDDMDGYYSDYFPAFAKDRPYVSLIFSEMHGSLVGSGRIWFRDRWREVTHFKIERVPATTLSSSLIGHPAEFAIERTKRLADAFGVEAARLLRESTVAVIGAGGTGSAAIEILARSGVGRLIVVDPDVVEASNLERIHGSVPDDAEAGSSKVEVARRHVASIDRSIAYVGLVGRLPQERVLDHVVEADLVLGCTDQGHSRVAIAELAWRFLLPAIDTGVALEGKDGHVRAQIMQLVTFRGAEPCAICTKMINPVRVTQELMSREEREQRIHMANEAVARGEDPNPYWTDIPQLNTVGYLTTTAGALAAGYAIGWMTGRFDAPFSRLQANFAAELLDTTDSARCAAADCACQTRRGWADQGVIWSQISAPVHWPEPVLIE